MKKLILGLLIVLSLVLVGCGSGVPEAPDSDLPPPPRGNLAGEASYASDYITEELLGRGVKLEKGWNIFYLPKSLEAVAFSELKFNTNWGYTYSYKERVYILNPTGPYGSYIGRYSVYKGTDQKILGGGQYGIYMASNDLMTYKGSATTSAVCGNGAVETGEACDDGNRIGETSCPYGTATCTGCGYYCKVESKLTGGFCGDGIKNGPEECDGGNLNSKTCKTEGFDGGTLKCTSSCKLDTGGCTFVSTCGNGVIEDPEICDDGNTVSGDGCSSTCNQFCGMEETDGIFYAHLKNSTRVPSGAVDSQVHSTCDRYNPVSLIMECAGDSYTTVSTKSNCDNRCTTETRDSISFGVCS